MVKEEGSWVQELDLGLDGVGAKYIRGYTNFMNFNL